MLLAVMAVLLFVVVPTALGYAIGHATTARLAWLAFGGVMAYSQSRDGDLGGMWVVVLLVAVVGLLFVQLGLRLRST